MSATRMPVTNTFFDRGRIRLIAIGRARGGSKILGEPLTNVGAVVDGVMASLSLELLCNTCIVGHRLGGRVALEIALVAPDGGLFVESDSRPMARAVTRFAGGAANDNVRVAA